MSAKEIAEKTLRLAAEATLGEWSWFGNTDSKSVYLATVKRGRVFVMDFVRWGMSGAAPRFNSTEGMKRVDDYAIYEVCSEAKTRDDERVYRADFHDVNHPDARYIAHASPENMQAVAQALLDALQRIGSLEDGLDEIRSSEIEDDPLSHALWAIRLAGETLYPSETPEASDE